MNICSSSHILAFDVDETLAESGQPLTNDMCDILEHLSTVKGYQLAFITSRSYAELEDRMPLDLLHRAYAFTCMGMEHWYEGDLVYQHAFNFSKGLTQALEEVIAKCEFPHKTGKHIVKRPSKGALSVVGEGHSAEDRASFIKWNKKSNFLNQTCKVLRTQFPELHFEAFGKTSIDFSDKRMSKAIVLDELRQFEKRAVVFFGDNMQDGGNDAELKDALLAEKAKNICVWVQSPAQSFSMLKEVQKANHI